jgi:hypothetical protein
MDSISRVAWDVRRHAHEPLNRHPRTRDGRASDNVFVRSGTLRLAFAIEPFPDQRSSQRSVRSIGLSVSEKNCAYGVFLARGHELGFLDGMRIRFRGGEETCPHHDAVGIQAERCCEAPDIGDAAGSEDERSHDAGHKANLMQHRDPCGVGGGYEFRRISPEDGTSSGPVRSGPIGASAIGTSIPKRSQNRFLSISLPPECPASDGDLRARPHVNRARTTAASSQPRRNDFQIWPATLPSGAVKKTRAITPGFSKLCGGAKRLATF